MLKRLKHGDESFSKVILRIGSEKRVHVERFFGILKKSNEETENMIRQLKERRVEFTKEMEARQERLKRSREGHGNH